MTSIFFATGNSEKFAIAEVLCKNAHLSLLQLTGESHEIQGEDPELIIRDKAQKKFELAGSKPVIVSDDSWDIPGLNGFPGAYMKSMDHWFTPQNFIDLTRNLKDRRILLHQYLAYKDESTEQIFHVTIPAKLITEARGNYGNPAQKIIMLDSDNGLTIAEVYDQGREHHPSRFSDSENVWQLFLDWHAQNIQI